jgi:UPF0755 protein
VSDVPEPRRRRKSPAEPAAALTKATRLWPPGRIRWVLVLLWLTLGLGAGGFFLWRDYQQFLVTPLLPPGQQVTILFARGEGLPQLLRHLEQAGVPVGAHWRWQLLARESRLARRLQAGEYRVDPRLTPPDLLRVIADGRVVMHGLSIEPGKRFADFRARVEAHPVLVQTLAGADDAEILKAIGATETHPEGLFLPETYFFPRGYTDRELYRRAYVSLQKALDEAWAARRESLPLKSPYEALILASIVEKETGRAFERSTIAGVFVRRLELGMRLQTDPTVIYGMGEAFDGNIRRQDLRADTPWNTYTRHGLPPTPIALVSRAALKAAVQPADGRELYFVARGDGTHQFSETLEQHNAAVRKYQLGQE